jgi:hypothetical protein
MPGLVCRSCGRSINPKEKYIGFNRPTGFSVMCTNCYEQNGGNSSKIRKRYSGSAADYYEQNLKGIRGTQLIRERFGHLTPEQRERREEFAKEYVGELEGIGEPETEATEIGDIEKEQLRQAAIERHLTKEEKAFEEAELARFRGQVETEASKWAPEFTKRRKEHEMSREARLNEEQKRIGWDDPYSIKGWTYFGKFYDRYTAHTQASNLETYNYETSVFPTKTTRIRPGRQSRIPRGFGKTTERPMWAVVWRSLQEEFAPTEFGAGTGLVTREMEEPLEALEEMPHAWFAIKPVEGQIRTFKRAYKGMEKPYIRMEGNPVAPRRMVLHIGELGSLSVGMLYKILNVMRTRMPDAYGPTPPTMASIPTPTGITAVPLPPITYYITMGDFGIEITDDVDRDKAEVLLLVPYQHLYRVEEIITNLEEHMRYTGEPTQLPWRELYHHIAPQMEPPIYTMSPPQTLIPLLSLPGGGEVGYMIVPGGGLTTPGVKSSGFMPYVGDVYGRKKYGPRLPTKQGALMWLLEQGYTFSEDVMKMLKQHLPLPPREIEIKTKELWREGAKSVGITESGTGFMTRFRAYIDTGEMIPTKEVVKYQTEGPCVKCGQTGKIRVSCTKCSGLGKEFDDRTRTQIICAKCGGMGTEEVVCDRCEGTKIMRLPASQWISLEERIVDKPRVRSVGPFKYEQQAVEWLVSQGYPVKVEEAMSLSFRGEKKEKEIELGPASEALPKLPKPKREKKKVETIPLTLDMPPPLLEQPPPAEPPIGPPPTEQNPLGLLESAIAGAAAGMASGATVAAVNAYTNKKRRRRKG